jgi:YfiH family protein
MATPFIAELETKHPELLRWATWTSIPWLAHGFSTRIGAVTTAYSQHGESELNLGFTAEDDRERVLANRAALVRAVMAEDATLVTLRQVHSSVVHRVGRDLEAGNVVPSGDGMMTDAAGLLLAIQTADCVPVLVVGTEHRAVAAFHAGWRGTLAGIVENGIAKMRQEFGSRGQSLSAVIGPCIGPCCYSVGAEVVAGFTERFVYGGELFSEVRPDGSTPAVHLDLVEANRRQLLASGLAADNIHAMRECTVCQPEKFFSYRKSGGKTGRMMSVIGVR